MDDGYDRFENEGSGGGSFVMGLLTGTVLGAVLAIGAFVSMIVICALLLRVIWTGN